ncbi:hypothetical protein P168DRAFT_326444 [Aspergillus campestris IBT 28561]|uniref:Methyltransferase domain-containing protein n=1 Tax=Aspergillus campestris (strain IBT 28561) TaxID=1392248 RepID=A0A2I1D425_ASPC2|nr:uncharacterized protein P168DRAFT_326444 [Aspergillus campestris IBT 28561]PKY04624.1 hypothetical protein P168DRAFT_326444 [Aspergillus campestris IBT 28561]
MEAYNTWNARMASATSMSDEARTLLQNYTGLAPSLLPSHVHTIAKRGFTIAPYPYFSKLWFVDFEIALSPAYGDILGRVQDGERMLHLGCGVGQDIRRMVYDGAPSENLCGLDPHRGLAELGYELFRDRDGLGSSFVVGDFMQDGLVDSLLGEGKFRVINTGYFLHVWDWKGQVELVKRMLKVLPGMKDDLVVGVNFARCEEREGVVPGNGVMSVHTHKTILKLWEEVGQSTGTRWRVEVSKDEYHDHQRLGLNGYRLRWSARRE